MLSWLFQRRGWDDEAGRLYEAMVAQARRPEFYLHCAVPDTLDGRFDLLVLHAFLLLHRLRAGGREAARLAQTVFDLMFADMDSNLRELGVSDLAVGHRVKAMARALYGRIAAYEPGLEDAGRLEDALRRNLYRGAPVPSAAVSAMARYVRTQAAELAAQPMQQFLSGRVLFGEPAQP